MVFKQLVFFLVSAGFCQASVVKSLNGHWTFSDVDTEGNAKVPGGVFSDLMNADVIDDIFYGYGDSNYSWIGERDWTYTTTVTIDEELLAYRVVSLVFEGVDTFATIWVNNKEAGTTQNMFVRYVFDVKDQLKVGSNEITVAFTSAVTEAALLADDPSNKYVVPPECPADEYHGICHANRVRKMQASFSWDWGPAFASVGIWKDVYLQAHDDAVIDYVVVNPVKNRDKDVWTLSVTTYLDTGGLDTISGTLNLTLSTKNSQESTSVEVTPTLNEYSEVLVTTSLEVSSDRINVWWPNGFGSQDLYNLVVTFTGKNEEATKTVRVGFRTIELVQNKLDNGLTFFVKINDRAIFAKGANEIPINVLPEKGQDQDTIKFILESARDVHMNMLRVWGGGVYESDYFYDLADEYGLLIWQDFMFACAMYPTDDAYLENVRAEVRHQVKRLGSHASVALLSGNNENEGALRDNWYGTKDNFEQFKEDYIKLYVNVIGEEVARIVPHIDFVLSSPTNGLETEEEGYIADSPGDRLYGDIHFYDYYSNGWDTLAFPIPRFASEFGYQSMPSIESWLTATESLDDLKPGAPFLESRQHHPNGTDQNLGLIDIQLKLPDLSSKKYVEALIYFSQVFQAQSLKVESEHYRSFKGRLNDQGEGYTMGALYWQLNDVWVAPTWSGIDFTKKWKMLHYFARDFFTPLIVTGRLTPLGVLEIYAILDDLEVPDDKVHALVHIYQWDSTDPLVAVEFPVTLDTELAVLVTSIDAKDALKTAGCGETYVEARQNCFFHLHLMDSNNNFISPFNYVFPEKLKNCNLADANVQIDSIAATDEYGKEFDIVVSTDAVALFVWLDSHDTTGIFSDNGFLHVLPTKTVHFVADKPTSAKHLENVLTVTHLRDPAYL